MITAKGEFITPVDWSRHTAHFNFALTNDKFKDSDIELFFGTEPTFIVPEDITMLDIMEYVLDDNLHILSHVAQIPVLNGEKIPEGFNKWELKGENRIVTLSILNPI